MARRSVISTLAVAAGAVTLLGLTLLLISFVAPSEEGQPSGARDTLLYLVYGSVAVLALLVVFLLANARKRLAHNEMDGFDLYLALRDAAMTSVFTGLVGTAVGGITYFALLVNERFLAAEWRLVPVLCAIVGTGFSLTALALAISFEAKAIRAARTQEAAAS